MVFVPSPPARLCWSAQCHLTGKTHIYKQCLKLNLIQMLVAKEIDKKTKENKKKARQQNVNVNEWINNYTDINVRNNWNINSIREYKNPKRNCKVFMLSIPYP